LQPFFARADAIQKDLQGKIDKVEKDFQDLVVKYAEDPKGITPEEFFGVFARFLEFWHVSVFPAYFLPFPSPHPFS